MNTTDTTEAPIRAGSVVRFREDTPQFAKCGEFAWVVEPVSDEMAHASKDGASLPDNTRNGRLYVSIVIADDLAQAPSKQRRRTAYVDALQHTAPWAEAQMVRHFAALASSSCEAVALHPRNGYRRCLTLLDSRDGHCPNTHRHAGR